MIYGGREVVGREISIYLGIASISQFPFRIPSTTTTTRAHTHANLPILILSRGCTEGTCSELRLMQPEARVRRLNQSLGSAGELDERRAGWIVEVCR